MAGIEYLPIDMNGVQPSGGFAPKPEGWYVLHCEHAEIKTKKDQSGQYVQYSCLIKMGPNWSQEFVDKKYNDMIGIDQKMAGRHMELLVACYGSLASAQQLIAQHGGRFAPQMCEGRSYIAKLSVNGNFNNVDQRLPYTQEEWVKNVGQPAAAAPSLIGAPVPSFQAPAPAPAYQAPQAPPAAYPAPAPAFAPPPAAFAPPTPAFAPPVAPAVGFPAPPPPGVPAGR